MNDDFFSSFRQSPRAEFSQSLYEKLIQETGSRQFMRRNIIANRIFLAAAALCLALALAIAVSPAVRAAVTDIIKTIILKGTTVLVSDDQPAISEKGESYSAIWTPVHPSDISRHPFFAKLPAWVPSNYVLQERSAFVYGSMYQEMPSSVLVEWKDDRGGTIQLSIDKGSCPNGPLYDSGSRRSDCTRQSYFSVGAEAQPEIVTVNGQSAVLFHNLQLLWDLSGPVRKWNPIRGKFNNRDPEASYLIWEADGRTFDLAIKSKTITQEDLIRLAESIPQ